jgi:hypothetical protein
MVSTIVFIIKIWQWKKIKFVKCEGTLLVYRYPDLGFFFLLSETDFPSKY